MTIWECALRDSELREIGLNNVAEWIESDWASAEVPPRGTMST
jgi:G:T-mismatch repair DNA endonuclease (very short patch repair protein)